jgi:hypothetical protein
MKLFMYSVFEEKLKSNKGKSLVHTCPGLRMLKNTVVDATDLQSVKHIEDQNIAHGKHRLGWKEYLELLFSSCSDYDKSHTNVHPAQCKI